MIFEKYYKSLDIYDDGKTDDKLRITYVCSTSSDCTRLYIEYLLGKEHRELLHGNEHNDEWVEQLKKQLLRSLKNNSTNLPHQCFSGSNTTVTCRNGIQSCLFHRTSPPSVSIRSCSVANNTEQAYVVIESVISAKEQDGQLFWESRCEFF